MHTTLSGIGTAEFEAFKNADYKTKVVLFDRYFGIIPFQFPDFDIEAKWYNNTSSQLNLFSIFREDSRNLNIYEKTIPCGNEILRFDIKPAGPKDRIVLNEYLLSLFLSKRSQLEAVFEMNLEQAPNKVEFLENRLDGIANIVNWAKFSLENQDPFELRVKFLRIFYNGYLAFSINTDNGLNQRRRFVELFLFSQGMMLAEHYHLLQIRLSALKNPRLSKRSLSLPLKIVLLQRLGIIELLERGIRSSHIDAFQNRLADLICLIISEQNQNQGLILQHLLSLSSGTSKDLLTEENLKVVDEELEKLGLFFRKFG